MSIKIIGGAFKNRGVKAPNTTLSKPTMSLMRKSVFDICQPYIQDAYFLDLFACSGAMGIEALSRGGAYSVFVDKDRKAAQCIKENINSFSLQKKSLILCLDAISALKKLEELQMKFHIVYLDPPYTHIDDITSPAKLLPYLDTSPLLEEGAVVLVEEAYPGHLNLGQLSLQKTRWKNSRKFSSSLLHQFIYTA